MSNTQRPSARHAYQMTYDAARQQIIVFGGKDNEDNRFQDTWAWCGERWHLLAETGPCARAWHGMTYDSHRNVIVLFGGRYGGFGETCADTWEWDGAHWTQVTDAGPAGRDHINLAYDPLRQKTVLFGGFSAEGLLTDTWEWDGLKWHSLEATGPRARAAGQLVYSPEHQGILLTFGRILASDERQILNDVWVWRGKMWEQLVDGEFPPRSHSCLTQTSNGLLAFGGLSLDGSTRIPLGDTWLYRDGIWTEQYTSNPSPRFDCSLAYDDKRQLTYLFGGALPQGEAVMDDFWAWDGQNWLQVEVGS